MKEREHVRRRSFIGTVATVAAGAGAGVGAAEGSDEQHSRTNAVASSVAASSVADYANRAGRIGTDGLQAALDDWNNGAIGRDLLDRVTAAWNTGERVVEKTVVELTDDVGSDRTLERNPDDPNGEAVVYQVQNSIDVGARLTVEPGAVIEFTQGTRLNVDSEAALVAEGTATDPILLTATNARRGWWGGVYVNSGNPDGSMEHVVVEYGGGGLRADVVVESDGTTALSNCTLRRSGEYGVAVKSGAELQAGSGDNVYAHNAAAPAYARTGTMHALSASSVYTDNDNDYVYVDSENVTGGGPDTEERTWSGLGVPYWMDGGHKVEELDLTIEAGATFAFTEGSGLHLAANCRFTVVGRDPEAEEPNIVDPITFTGTEKQRGWWSGLYVSSVNADNVLRNVVVEYGGNGENGNLSLGNRFREAAVCEIKGCTFRQADGYGMVLGGSQATGYSNNVDLDSDFNTYTENADGPVRIHTSQIHYLSNGSDFTGNDTEEVYVANGENANADNLDADAIEWSNINVPYHMDSSDHWVNDVELSVEPGAEFRFEEEGLLAFNNEAVMSVEGSEAEPILFTGTEQQRGWWDGIYVETRADNNTLRHAIVEYGANGEDANLSLGNRFREYAELAITDCTFRHADGYGMILGGGEGTGYTNNVTLHEMDNNVYTANADGPASINTPQVHYLATSSDFTGNDTDEVYVANGQNLNESSVDVDAVTWSAINVPYRFDDSTHAVDHVDLTVEPGVECRFEETARVRFKENSSFTMEGTEDEQITLTGTEEIAGWWDGVSIQSPSLTNTMDYVVVEYGGRDLAGNLDLAETGFRQNAALTLTNSTIRHSRAAGLYVNEGERINDDVCEVNTFADNEGGDCVVE